jgi:hypothetical protein
MLYFKIFKINSYNKNNIIFKWTLFFEIDYNLNYIAFDYQNVILS